MGEGRESAQPLACVQAPVLAGVPTTLYPPHTLTALENPYSSCAFHLGPAMCCTEPSVELNFLCSGSSIGFPGAEQARIRPDSL